MRNRATRQRLCRDCNAGHVSRRPTIRRVDETYVARSASALRAALRYADMDATALAARIGYNAETVRRWVRGDTEIRANALSAVADALDVPIDVLVRPPATADEALMQIAAWRGVRRAARSRD